MRGGFSSCKGIMIYDTSRDIPNAFYGYYEDDKIIVLEGSYEEVKKIRKQHKEIYERKDNKEEKIILLLFLIMLFISIVSFFVFPFLIFLSIFVFCIGSYFPIIVLIFANMNTYINEEMYHQSKRYHASEHALMNIIDEEEITLEKLKKSSIYEAECGNVYCGYFLFLLIILCYLIVNIVGIGILKAIGILLLTIILLFINIFNPYNPFKILQKPTIEQPTDKEYLLAMELIEVWQRNGKEIRNDSKIIVDK